MSKTSIFITILACVGAFAAIVVGLKVYRVLNPYLDREVTGPVTLSPQWLQVVPKPPLLQERKGQYIVLKMAEHLITPNPAAEPTLEDGSTVTFEVELIDQNGTVHPLTDPAGDGRTEIWRGLSVEERHHLPPDIVFRTLRVRSNKTIRCSEILWRAYDPRDFK